MATSFFMSFSISIPIAMSISSMLTFDDNATYIAELEDILTNPKTVKNSANYDIFATTLAEAYISNDRFEDVINLLSERTLDRSSNIRITDRILNLINLEDAFENEIDSMKKRNKGHLIA